MGKWINEVTGALVSVADEKDHRFGDGWRSADAPVKVPAPVAVSVPVEPKRGPGRPKKTEE